MSATRVQVSGSTPDLALVFEAASQLDDEGHQLVKALIEGTVLRQQSRRFANYRRRG